MLFLTNDFQTTDVYLGPSYIQKSNSNQPLNHRPSLTVI